MKLEKLVSLTLEQADGIMIGCAIRRGRIIRDCKAGRVTVLQAYFALRNIDEIEAALVSADLW